MKTFSLLFPLLLVFVTSCEYKPDTENFKYIDTTNLSMRVYIEVTPEPGFSLEYVTMIHYRVRSYGATVYQVRALINGYPIYESNHLADSFMISPYDVTPGLHHLEIQAITESKTNSLAEMTGHEALLFHRIIEFYTLPSEEIFSIKNITNDNGYLKIQWDTSMIPSFSKYEVYVFNSYYGYPYKIAEISNRYHTSYYDKAYIGGAAEYSVQAIGKYQSIGAAMNVDFPYPKLDTLWTTDSSVKFFWNKPAFYKAVNGYNLVINTSSLSEYPLFSSRNLNDTTYAVNTKKIQNQSEYKLHFYTNYSYAPYSDQSHITSSIELKLNPATFPF